MRRPQSADALHFFAEAGKLAYADRARYLGDPAFVPVPIKRLLHSGLPRQASEADRRPGHAARAAGRSPKRGTSHFSIVDARGDIVSMTTTIEAAFGSRIMVRGFLLNNQLTDFDFVPGGANAWRRASGRAAAWRPTIGFPGRPARLALGSPGGSMIINYVAKALVGTLDWGSTSRRRSSCRTSARATGRR